MSADIADYPLMFSGVALTPYRRSEPLSRKYSAAVNANVPFDPAPPLFRLSRGAFDRDHEFWLLGARLLACVRARRASACRWGVLCAVPAERQPGHEPLA